jgi:uncharacterized protein YcsI (UPF0317 family)
VEDDTITVSIDMPRAQEQFVGKFSDEETSSTGRWEWTQDGVTMGCDATMTRVEG